MIDRNCFRFGPLFCPHARYSFFLKEVILSPMEILWLWKWCNSPFSGRAEGIPQPPRRSTHATFVMLPSLLRPLNGWLLTPFSSLKPLTWVCARVWIWTLLQFHPSWQLPHLLNPQHHIHPAGHRGNPYRRCRLVVAIKLD